MIRKEEKKEGRNEETKKRRNLMTSNTLETPVTICPVCGKEILSMPSSRSGQQTMTQVTTCCGLFKTAHFNCAKNFSINIKKDDEFDPKSYINDTSSPLLCGNCNELCFHCGRKKSWQIRWLFFYA